jgi:chemotaxis signal transduction protein
VTTSVRRDPDGVDRASGTATALRSSFDAGFAVAATSMTQPLESLLAIRVGSDPYALRLSQIAGLHADLRIVAIPSPVAQLLGIVGLRGTMAPVYDLAALLRYPSAANPRWMVLAVGSQPVGLAFEGFEAHVQVPKGSLADEDHEASSSATTQRHLRGSVRVAGVLRPIIHIASVVEMIRDNNP